jgi:predicted  nucleic acid-binding Zn-ribbon protein
MSDISDKDVYNIECSCNMYSDHDNQRARRFLTKEVEILKEYQKDLERESQGVSERIKELEAN